MSQLMNLVDEQDKIIGQENIEKIHQKGFLHRAVHIFIVNSSGRLFCRQRSAKKKIYPGYWSTSVGAHVLSGQTYDPVAKQSLKKDLGINCKLVLIGKARVHDQYENEISATYVGYSDKTMKLNPQQIEGGKFLTIQEIKRLTKRKNVTPHLAHSLEMYLQYTKSQQEN